MKKILLLSCILLSTYGLSAQKLMSGKTFTRLYLNSLQESNPHTQYKILNSLEILARNGENEVTHYLDKAYQEYVMHPEEHERIMSRYVMNSILLYIEQAKIKRENIVPVIKPRSYLDYLAQLNKEQGANQEPVFESYNEDLIIVFAEDQKNSISFFGRKAFEELNISRDTLRMMAIKNLDRILPPMERRGGQGRYMLSAGGDYEASLILMPGIWNQENFPVDGDIVIAIPNRDVLLVTGSNSQEESLAELEAMCADSYRTGRHAISEKLFIWAGGKFTSWEE